MGKYHKWQGRGKDSLMFKVAMIRRDTDNQSLPEGRSTSEEAGVECCSEEMTSSGSLLRMAEGS